ncbi:MAG: hypothetical protein AB4290_09075 [Spirulina sp.]
MANLVPSNQSHRKVGRLDVTKKKGRGKKRKRPLREVSELNRTTAFQLARTLYLNESGLRGILAIAPDLPAFYVHDLKYFLTEDCDPETLLMASLLLENYNPRSHVFLGFPENLDSFERDKDFRVRMQVFPRGSVMANISISLPKPLNEFSSEDLKSFVRP